VASEAGDACPSHAQHTRSRGILPRVARTRKRFWAWTLTLTAALLAVVLVGSMRWGMNVWWPPRYTLGIGRGQVEFISSDLAMPARRAEIEHLNYRGWWVDWWWFGFGQWKFNGMNLYQMWNAPLWPFILLTGGPGLWMLFKPHKYTNPNACPACGYDRTGLPQTSTGPAPCPECGKGKDDDAMKG